MWRFLSSSYLLKKTPSAATTQHARMRNGIIQPPPVPSISSSTPPMRASKSVSILFFSVLSTRASRELTRLSISSCSDSPTVSFTAVSMRACSTSSSSSIRRCRSSSWALIFFSECSLASRTCSSACSTWWFRLTIFSESGASAEAMLALSAWSIFGEPVDVISISGTASSTVASGTTVSSVVTCTERISWLSASCPVEAVMPK
mmetsp:Transcript_167594/g.407399  ORF Transcript_167594/g.407399 Transcript_167594/m.407399 type:complete len:204 (+) Transcript_167594:237-848(+)